MAARAAPAPEPP